MDRLGARAEEIYARVAAGALLFIPAVCFAPGFSEGFRFPKLLAGQGLVFLLLPPAIMMRRRRDVVALAMMFSFLCALVSLAKSVHMLTGLQELARLGTLAGAFLLMRQTDRPARLWPLVMAAGLLNATIAFGQAAGWRSGWFVPWEGRHAIYGTFGNPNFLAEFLSPLAIVAAGEWLASPSARRGAAALAAFSAFIALLLLTVSRSAWCGLASGAALALILAGRPVLDRPVRKRGFWLLGAVALMLLAAWRPLATRIASTSLSSDPGVTTRLFMWRAAAGMFAANPWLGAGPGSYRLEYLDQAGRMQKEGAGRPAYPGVAGEAHSDPLQLLAERGLAGIIGGIIIMAAGFQAFGLTRPGAYPDRLRRAAYAGALLAILLESFFGFPFRIMPTAVLFLWLAACALDRVEAPWCPVCRFTHVGVLIIFLPVLALTWRTLAADAALAAGRRTGGGEKYFRKGLALLPSHGELRFQLGRRLMAQGRLEQAKEEFAAAMAGYRNPDVYFNLGLAALRGKDYAEAARWYGEGIRRYPYFNARPYADLAEALLQMGRSEEARQAARAALRIDPGLERARRILEEIGR